MKKARLKPDIEDEVKRESSHRGGWAGFNSIYGTGRQAYDKTFLGVFFVEETLYDGVYTAITSGRTIGTVHLDHIDIIPEYSFKNDIFKILEM